MVPVHYGWIIAGSAMVALSITNGLIIPCITVFDESLLEEFGWSRGALKFRDLLTFAVAGLLGPFAGALADRFGVRRLMLFGAALLAVSLLRSAWRAPGNLSQRLSNPSEISRFRPLGLWF